MDQKYLQTLFDYHPDGYLVWKTPRRGIRVGEMAGHIQKDGRYKIQIDGNMYLGHRIIYLYHHGFMPEYVDHQDRDTGNNRIENLRECTLSQNQQNRKVSKNNTSGHPNVKRNRQRWVVEKSAGGEYFRESFPLDEYDKAVECAKKINQKYAF